MKISLASTRGSVRRNCCAQALKKGDKVVVAGATGGVGQLAVQKLLDKGFDVRVLTRDKNKAIGIFGEGKVDVCEVDLRDHKALESKSVFEGCDGAVVAVGTTAFPTSRWSGGNGPRNTDYESVKNLVSCMPKSLKHATMCTSAGVERANSFPFLILNIFGVLTYKKAGEECVKGSGIPYTIVRPGRLTEGPYTGKGLNDVILRQRVGRLRGITLSNADDMSGEAARSMVAEFIAQSFLIDELKNRVLALESNEVDEGPGTDTEKWKVRIPPPH